METIQKQEYRVRDLPTRSITLFPTRAQVVRDIKDVDLKPGLNQISIVGFTPTVDKDSIKVEGTGSAVISDISIELLENQDIYQEIYPSDSSDEEAEIEDDDESSLREESSDENPSSAKQELKEIEKKIQAVGDELKCAAEVVANAESRLGMLDEFVKQFEPKSGSDVSDIVQTYQDQREKIFQNHTQGTLRQRELNEDLQCLCKTKTKLQRRVQKERATAMKAERKEQQARRRNLDVKMKRREKKQAEKKRVRQERLKFWARSCYVVRITLDATQYTPISSRRSSVASVTDLVKPVVGEQDSSADTEAVSCACDLSITYVTCAAFWSPSYDLQLSTTSNTGTLFFDAQLTNNTSESWKDCKIILSTSQAVFSGLQDAIPKLIPWHIKLAAKSGPSSYVLGDITSSAQESKEQFEWNSISYANHQTKSGTHLIGTSDVHHAAPSNLQRMIAPLQGTPPTKGPIFGQPAQNSMRPSGPQATSGGLFGNNATQASGAASAPQQTGGGLFGNTTARQGTGGGLFGGLGANANSAGNAFGAAPAVSLFGQAAQSAPQTRDHDGPDPSSPVDEANTLLEPESELSFQESAMEETGFTTIYDLPGTKSLVPSSTASKQRVAHIAFTNIVFSHTIVAKYRPAAYLKAKLRNASKISLLKGPVGLTLDGAFMGRSTLPRCSSSDSFTMSLGIDPAIRVTYPKPDVKRSTTGMFTKENSTAYTRSVTIANTRGSSSSSSAADGNSKAVKLLVLDQIPVSEDEKLRVEILQPRGLAEGGAGVGTGVQDSSAKDGKDWGRATATLKKGGEINWDVELNAGKSVKLALEYDVSLPAGDHAVQADKARG